MRRDYKMKQDTIHIFTDGACKGNPGPAGWGAVLVFNTRVKELSAFIGNATNNIAELTAVKRALEAVRDRALPACVYLDSTYSIGVLTMDWKIKANHRLVHDIRALIDSFENISFHKVTGHNGVKLNERADHLARATIKQHLRAHRL